MNRYFQGVLLIIVAGLLFACSDDTTGNRALEEAKSYLAAGKTKAATIELKNALQKSGDNQQARWLLGELYFNRGAYADAEKELRIARDLGQPDNDVLPLLARSYLMQGDYESLQALGTSDLSGASLSGVLASQGLGMLYQDKLDDAARLIQDAVKQTPNSPYVMLADARLTGTKYPNDLKRVRPILAAILNIDPEYAPAWSLLGDIERQALDFQEAEKAYTRALNIDVERLEDRYNRALIRLQKENMEGAAEDVAILLERGPKSPAANYLQGILHFRNGNMKDAIVAFGVAQTAGNRYPMSLYYLAVAHRIVGNKEQANDYANRFIAFAPNSRLGRKLAATIRLEAGNAAEAETLLRPIVEANSDDIDAVNLLAGALLHQGKTEEGLDLLSRVVSENPDLPGAQEKLGAGLLASGKVAGSFEHIEKAQKLNPESRQADLLLVSANYLKGDFEGALAAVDVFEKKNPNSVISHNLRGQIYLKLSNMSQARSAFNESLAIAADDPIANDKLAFIAIQEKDLDSARRYYQAILETHPDYLPILLKMAALSELQKDYVEMESLLRRAIKAHPNRIQPRVILARYYLQRGEPGQVPVILRTLDQESRNSADVLNVLALSHLNRRDFNSAKSVFQQLIALRPDAPQPHYHLGLSYQGLGEEELGQVQFEKAVKLSPDYLEPRIELTRILLRKQNKTAVESNLSILKKLAPDHPEVLQFRSVDALWSGNIQEAVTLSGKAFERAPTTRNMLVHARQRWAAGDKAAAQSIIKNWLEDYPNDLQARLELASIFMSKGENKAAIEQYSAVLDIAPRHVTALNNLAWLVRESNPQAALNYAKQAVEISGKTPETLDTLAVLLLNNGDLIDAKNTIQQALAGEGSNPQIQYHNALINSAAGHTESAIEILETLLREEKDFSERQQAKQLLMDLTRKN